MGLLLSKVVGVEGLGKPFGPHQVGRASCRVPGGCWAQVFYPVAADAVDSGKREPYMRLACTAGMAASLKTSATLLATWAKAPNPFLSGAPLVEGFAGPVVVFQHGLHGNAEIYSKICGDLAANGCVVVACEHEDGSASCAWPEGSAEPLRYQAPPEGTPYTREKVAAFRGPMLVKRTAEVEAVLRYALADEAANVDDVVLEEEGEDASSSASSSAAAASDADAVGLKVLRSAVSSCETKFFLAGHSFGSCGTVFATSRSAYLKGLVSGQVLLDLWSYPLDEATIGAGLQVLPALSVLTGQFHDNDEVPLTKALLAATAAAAAAAGPGKECTSLWVPGTLHQTFSDSPWLMGAWLAKRTGVLGAESKDVSQRAIVDAMLQVILPSGGEGWDSLVAGTPALERLAVE